MVVDIVELGPVVRFLLAACSVLIIVIMSVRIIVNFRHLSRGQWFFKVGSLCFVIYGADALRAGISANLPFAPRLVAVIIGVACLFAWSLEPERLQERDDSQGDPLRGRWHWRRRGSDGRPDEL